jgi:CRP-like cAMP-binding protein
MDAPVDRRRITQNRILRALPPHEYTRLSRCVARVRLAGKDVLSGSEADRAYFMMSGACSAVVTMAGGERVEVASVSCEGVTSALAYAAETLGVHLIVAVSPASALCLSVSELNREMDRRGMFRDLVTDYYRSLNVEVMLTVACNRLHPARNRYCKKILTLANRVGSETIHVTQAMLATMLGTNRPSVTLIALELKRKGVISYGRNFLTITDRARLEADACECYHLMHARMGRTTPPDRAPSAVSANSAPCVRR